MKMQNCGGPSGEVSTLVFYWPATVGFDCVSNPLSVQAEWFHCRLLSLSYSIGLRTTNFGIYQRQFLVPLQYGYFEQPRNGPYRPFRSIIREPHFGQPLALASVSSTVVETFDSLKLISPLQLLQNLP